ncbi:hypothetical protein Calag_1407 [Caldisphaera lagunensis DSM 15908]|uniref:Uncharacterized protein n=1 Tax=Caldisphaera lagunensis (strain DSM 15908 / JCM 11604 / ANMR 0165 / IC-154) TaxID=1056495 RepID=L0ACH9_CALLD|nr:flippase-like domain-containing protein [Caldisphaera lagunensis]AFZ71114.1 hypothetical protein Calag_1407 [Caldisphaera lagunensis DSM 15908]
MNKRDVLKILSVIVLMLLVFTIILENPIKILLIIYEGNILLLFTFLLLMLSEVIKSFRLYYTCRFAKNCKLRLFDSIKIQLSSFFYGTITPGNIGGVPSMASLLNKYNQTPLGEAFGISSSQAFFDGIIPSLASFLFSLFYLPESLGITLFSLFTIIFWSLVFNINIKSFSIKILDKISIRNLKERIIKEIDTFQESLNFVKNKKLLFGSLIISIISYLIQTFSIMILLNKNISIFKLFIALMFNYAMAIFPTPAGEGGAEYGLAVLLPINIVVMWRLSYILSGLVSGLSLI